MKITHFIIISISLFLNTSCNAQSNDSVATFKVNSNSSIQIRRVHIHAFLAEYDRYLSLVVDGKTVTEIQISTDTGGYSQANVFATNTGFAVQDRMGRYEANEKNQQIKELEQVCKNPKDDVFVGAFDTDKSKSWRFISAPERKYVPILVSGCAEKF